MFGKKKKEPEFLATANVIDKRVVVGANIYRPHDEKEYIYKIRFEYSEDEFVYKTVIDKFNIGDKIIISYEKVETEPPAKFSPSPEHPPSQSIGDWADSIGYSRNDL